MKWLKQNWLKKELTIKSDILVVFINGFIVMGGVFILNGLIARLYGLSILGEFLLLKRTVVAGAAIVLRQFISTSCQHDDFFADYQSAI